jgi:Fur family transcriptional regulator, peroxide stress response regulator
MNQEEARELLAKGGLRITPQRLIVIEALFALNNHPTVEQITEYVHKVHPNIATGTVYKILETLVEKGALVKVKTIQDAMRYDAISEKHHHLYCSESDRIEDYYDEDLTSLLTDYFREHEIPGFNIDDIKLQINGKFNKNA